MRPAADYEGPLKVPADCVHASSWGAMYNAGFLTYPRHHASGMATWVTIGSGVQMWTLFRPRWDDPERTKAARRVLVNTTPEEHPAIYEDMFDVGTLMLTPGNVLYVLSPHDSIEGDLNNAVVSCLPECFTWCTTP